MTGARTCSCVRMPKGRSTRIAGRQIRRRSTNQVQIVLSRELALDVIGKLKLNELPEFDPVLAGTSLLRHVLAMAGITRDLLAMSPEERVLESWFDRLTAYSVDKSRVIVVEFQSGDPALAARVTNAVAETYLRLQQSLRQEQTRGASLWLAGEIDTLRIKVADAEAKVEDFRSRTNLLVGTNNTTLSGQQLGEFNSQLGVARGQKADAETRARIIRDMLRAGEPIEASDVVNSELIRRLSEQRVTLRAQLPSSPRRCSTVIRASRNSRRRSPISTARCGARPRSSSARSKTRRESPAPASTP